MKKYLIIGIILLGIVSLGTLTYFRDKKPVETPLRASESVVQDCSVTDNDVISAVNKYRAEMGVNILVFNEKLDGFADQRATNQNGILDAHVGLQPLLDETKLGLYTLVGEDQNHWVGCHNSLARVDDFKLSDKHWTSLMNPRYDEIGVGYYNNVLNINLGDLR